MNDDRLRRLLRDALPAAPDIAPPRDLWPDLLGRLDRPLPRPGSFDWALAALAAAWMALFPQTLTNLLIHL